MPHVWATTTTVTANHLRTLTRAAARSARPPIDETWSNLHSQTVRRHDVLHCKLFCLGFLESLPCFCAVLHCSPTEALPNTLHRSCPPVQGFNMARYGRALHKLETEGRLDARSPTPPELTRCHSVRGPAGAPQGAQEQPMTRGPGLCWTGGLLPAAMPSTLDPHSAIHPGETAAPPNTTAQRSDAGEAGKPTPCNLGFVPYAFA